jgi:hypothetical protein
MSNYLMSGNLRPIFKNSSHNWVVTEKGIYREEVLTQCLSYGMTWGQISLFLGSLQNIECLSLSVHFLCLHSIQ